jgi:hypothetical protein
MLVAERSQWRIHDILHLFPKEEHDKTESLRKQLKDEIESYFSSSGSRAPR